MNASDLIKKVAEAKTGAEAAPLVEAFLADLTSAWSEYRDGVRQQSKTNRLSFYEAVTRSELTEVIDGMLTARPGPRDGVTLIPVTGEGGK